MTSVYEKTPLKIVVPEFKGRLLYMHKTPIASPELPDEFADFEPVLSGILRSLKNQEMVCYVTIDEKTVENSTHRRPGLHVDFNWYEEVKGHGGGGHSPSPSHKNTPDLNGGMLLAATHPGCRVYRGEFEGEISEGGDCTGIDVTDLENEVMEENHLYFLNPLGIHEPLVIQGPVNRTLVRINFHPEYVWQGIA